jgi:Kef-type K+ transport system membrane component KefB
MTLVKQTKPVAWMVGASGVSCLALVAATGSSLMPELVLGMAGPLTSAVVTWQVLERTHASTPERLTGVMITAFGVKVLLFALYVVVLLGALELRPKPFMLSFTGYYVGLHVIEARFLRRLLTDGMPRWQGEGRRS